ncbi:MAG: glycosyltransferase family 2 protein [Leptolyngbyaceae cyanobacterium SL_7_1]|nr:glycosyltransferase family 2 protein [Leptolyngbyaceae cyanobacterium SL_7_1]
MISISAVILTKNEEQFIDRCINSILWVDEIVVLDSGSTDRTREIATTLGATVYEQEWLGYSAQREQAISLAKNDWILFLDSDEIVTPELARSIQTAMSIPVDERDGYSMDRRGDFLGILLPNESRRSKRLNFVRLFNRKYSGYDRSVKVHEEVQFPGKAIPLEGILLHWRGYVMDEYISVFNRYATLEAQVLQDSGYRLNPIMIILRPFLRFLWCYVAKGEFRLGARGLIHALLKATGEYIRYAKLWEMQNTPRVLHPPSSIYAAPDHAAPDHLETLSATPVTAGAEAIAHSINVPSDSCTLRQMLCYRLNQTPPYPIVIPPVLRLMDGW